MVFLKRKIITLRSNIEYNIRSITNLATNSALNAKINEVKVEIPRINNIASTVAATTIENKLPSVSYLVKKADYDAEIKDVKEISDYNKSMNNIYLM